MTRSAPGRYVALAACAWLLALAGCSSGVSEGLREQDGPSSPDPPIDGIYTMCDEVAGYSGETIELLQGRFRYWFYSDVMIGEPPEYPLEGTYRLEGNRVVLEGAAIHSNTRTLARVNHVQVLWRDDGLKLWKSEKRVQPYAVLIRTGNAPVGKEMPERPTIRSLYSSDMVDREEREYRVRYDGLPKEVRVLLRAKSIRGDPDVRIYEEKITAARADLNPRLVEQLVGIMGCQDTSLSVEAESILEDLFLRTFLLPVDPPFRHDEKSLRRALNILVDAMSQARDRRALENALAVFLRTSGLKSISLTIPQAGVMVALTLTGEDGLSMSSGSLQDSPNAPGTHRWTDEIQVISRACQDWCRRQLETTFVFAPSSAVRIGEEEEAASAAFTEVDIPRLIDDLSADRAWGRRVGAAHGLASLNEKAVPALVQAVETDRSRSSMAAYALGKMREPPAAAVPALIRALRDTDADTRHHAAWALGRIGPAAKGAVQPLKLLLGDTDKRVRGNAAGSLESIQFADDTE